MTREGGGIYTGLVNQHKHKKHLLAFPRQQKELAEPLARVRILIGKYLRSLVKENSFPSRPGLTQVHPVPPLGFMVHPVLDKDQPNGIQRALIIPNILSFPTPEPYLKTKDMNGGIHFRRENKQVSPS